MKDTKIPDCSGSAAFAGSAKCSCADYPEWTICRVTGTDNKLGRFPAFQFAEHPACDQPAVLCPQQDGFQHSC